MATILDGAGCTERVTFTFHRRQDIKARTRERIVEFGGAPALNVEG
jgi:hypothetical protein